MNSRKQINDTITIGCTAVILAFLIFFIYFIYNSKDNLSNANFNEASNQEHSPSKENSQQTTLSTTQTISLNFDYEGTETNELGERHFYVLKIRKDFSSASLGDGNSQFLPLKLLNTSNGLYQFISGTIVGIKIQPEKGSCTIYNFDGSLFCVLSRKTNYE